MVMARDTWLQTVTILLVLLSGARSQEFNVEEPRAVYNHTLARILVEYASAVYMSDLTELFSWTCSRCEGLTKGFEVIELIVDVQHCLQGFVGVSEDLNAIIIAFRGTQEHSIQNWIEDLYWKQLDQCYPGMPGAMVHHGFYSSYHNTTMRPGVLSAIKRANQYYGELKIIVTGHSMGGAMATLCALDIKVHHKHKDVQVMTFGQPRIGNSVFASYYSQLLPNTIRVTHEHDIVPHLPPYYSYFSQKTYHHFPREIWLHNIVVDNLIYPVEQVCDASGEDPSCSRSVYGNSIADHKAYYGVNLMAETWNTCKIVMNPCTVQRGSVDAHGNILMSKDLSFLKLNTKRGGARITRLG